MPSFIGQVITTVITVTMCIIGLFGNVCMLCAHAYDCRLRLKICYIVTVIAFLHVICLLNELYLQVRQSRFHATSRVDCFRQTCVYIFAMMAQASMFLMLAVDHLLAVTMPIKHLMFPTLKYTLYLCAPPIFFASATVVFSIAFMNDDPIILCTPLQALPRNVQSVLDIVIVVNFAALLTLLFVIALVKWKEKKTSTPSSPRPSTSPAPHQLTTAELKMMRSFIVLVTVYGCSWCISSLFAQVVLRFFPPNSEFSLFVQTYVIITVVPTYCQIYFVSYFRSPHHRNAYRKQLRVLFPCIFRDKQEQSQARNQSSFNVRRTPECRRNSVVCSS